jgi:hypothetical protein
MFRSKWQMPAQKRTAGKNYIGLLSDELEEPRAVPSAADHRIKDYIRGLMAALFRRRGEAR